VFFIDRHRRRHSEFYPRRTTRPTHAGHGRPILFAHAHERGRTRTTTISAAAAAVTPVFMLLGHTTKYNTYIYIYVYVCIFFVHFPY